MAKVVSILTRTEVRVLRGKTGQNQTVQRFQSSPAPRCGCCPAPKAEGFAEYVSILTRTEVRVLREKKMSVNKAILIGFNPHPHRGAGAAEALVYGGARVYVSILTRTEVRVLRRGVGVWRGACVCFNPHPHRGAGAASASRKQEMEGGGFNPHPHRGAGAASKHDLSCFARRVSILTRTEVRVLHESERGRRWRQQFQSSPAPRCGCCKQAVIEGRFEDKFQSSPAPRCGCCNKQITINNKQNLSFNPHPHRGAGAALLRATTHGR